MPTPTPVLKIPPITLHELTDKPRHKPNIRLKYFEVFMAINLVWDSHKQNSDRNHVAPLSPDFSEFWSSLIRRPWFVVKNLSCPFTVFLARSLILELSTFFIFMSFMNILFIIAKVQYSWLLGYYIIFKNDYIIHVSSFRRHWIFTAYYFLCSYFREAPLLDKVFNSLWCCLLLRIYIIGLCVKLGY